MFRVRVPVPDEVKVSAVVRVDLPLLAGPVGFVGVPRTPVAPTRAGRALDEDKIVADAREQLAASLAMIPLGLPMTLEAGDDDVGENQSLAGMTQGIADHAATAPRQWEHRPRGQGRSTTKPPSPRSG